MTSITLSAMSVDALFREIHIASLCTKSFIFNKKCRDVRVEPPSIMSAVSATRNARPCLTADRDSSDLQILFWRRNLDKRVIGSNVLSPEPVAGWSPLAELIFESLVLVIPCEKKISPRELTFVVRKEAACITDEWLAVVYIETRIRVPKIAVD
jgi:hypothetical protein